MTYRVKLEVFEGPLDLLLALIRREELEITAVSLALVTDQYLAYMEQLQTIDPRAMASFLEVAAQLVLIKSRHLLPRSLEEDEIEDEEDPAEELARRLREYAQFKEVADVLRDRDQQGLRSYVRVALPPELPARINLSDVSIEDLLATIQEALNEKPKPSVSHVLGPVVVTIDEQSAFIRQTLLAKWPISFLELLRSCRSRLEIVITLLALLELMKEREIIARQDTLFGEIWIEPVMPVVG